MSFINLLFSVDASHALDVFATLSCSKINSPETTRRLVIANSVVFYVLHFSFPSTLCCLNFSRDGLVVFFFFFKIYSARFILAAVLATWLAAHLGGGGKKPQTLRTI